MKKFAMILSVAALSVFAVSCGEAAEKVDEAKEKVRECIQREGNKGEVPLFIIGAVDKLSGTFEGI